VANHDSPASPDAQSDRPILVQSPASLSPSEDDQDIMPNKIHVKEINGYKLQRPFFQASEYLNVFFWVTKKHLWMPREWARNKVLLDGLLTKPVNDEICAAASHVLRLTYHFGGHFPPGFRKYLRNYQMNTIEADDIFIGRCPLSGCGKTVTDYDLTHKCIHDESKNSKHRHHRHEPYHRRPNYH
jgi:hypothetical protein